jgi:hypothetical protein
VVEAGIYFDILGVDDLFLSIHLARDIIASHIEVALPYLQVNITFMNKDVDCYQLPAIYSLFIKSPQNYCLGLAHFYSCMICDYANRELVQVHTSLEEEASTFIYDLMKTMALLI